MSSSERKRGRFQGVYQVVRFNPGFYAFIFIILILFGLSVAVSRRTMNDGWSTAFWWFSLAAWLLLILGSLASLLASHWIYDLSDWRRGQWLKQILPKSTLEGPARILNVHSGFDETTLWLREKLPHAEVNPLDLFDHLVLTESSIHRARAYLPPLPGTPRGKPTRWPIEKGSCDAVLFLLSAHEFRSQHARVRLLVRASESLKTDPDACVILAEHGRDLANYSVFGPGFFHFFSPREWQHCWEKAGLVCSDHQHVTPFLHLWRLQRAPESSTPA